MEQDGLKKKKQTREIELQESSLDDDASYEEEKNEFFFLLSLCRSVRE